MDARRYNPRTVTGELTSLDELTAADADMYRAAYYNCWDELRGRRRQVAWLWAAVIILLGMSVFTGAALIVSAA